MALSLLNSTNSAVAVTLNAITLTCTATQITADFQRDVQTQEVFCDDNWEVPFSVTKRVRYMIGGFLAKGIAGVGLGSNFTSDDPVEIIYQADTGCTVTQDVLVTRDTGTVSNKTSSGRTIEATSVGAPVIAWVVA